MWLLMRKTEGKWLFKHNWTSCSPIRPLALFLLGVRTADCHPISSDSASPFLELLSCSKAFRCFQKAFRQYLLFSYENREYCSSPLEAAKVFGGLRGLAAVEAVGAIQGHVLPPTRKW